MIPGWVGVVSNTLRVENLMRLALQCPPFWRSFGIGQGPECRPFCDLRSVPETRRPREQVKNHGRACTQVLSLRKALPGFFHFLEIVTGRLVRSAGQKIPVQPGWYFPLQKIRLAENKFFQAGKWAENTKEKSRQCFTELEWLLCCQSAAILPLDIGPNNVTCQCYQFYSSFIYLHLQLSCCSIPLHNFGLDFSTNG